MDRGDEDAQGPVESFKSALTNMITARGDDQAQPPFAPAQNPIMQQFLEMMQDGVRGQGPRAQGDDMDKNYERVRRQGAKVFSGTTDPAVAEEWLRNTERILDRIDCAPEQRLKYAVSLLENDAYDWWESLPGSRVTPLLLTWADFLREFAEKYTPPVYKIKKNVEFLELKQKEQSVAEYELQFTRLSKYAPEEVSTDDMKRDRFERGLKLEIREKIVMKPPTYQALIETALRVEEVLTERSKTEVKRQRITGGSSASGSYHKAGSHFSRGSSWEHSGSGYRGRGSGSFDRAPSVTGGRGGSQGRGGRGPICFFCNKPGHFAKECYLKRDEQYRAAQQEAQSSMGENQRSGGRGTGRGAQVGRAHIIAGAQSPQ